MTAARGNVWRLWVVAGYVILTFGLSSIQGDALAPYISGYDLILHAIEYAALAWLILWYLSHTRWGVGNFNRAGWITLLLCALVGGLNELWQSQVPGRFPAVSDELANVFGATVAILGYSIARGAVTKK